MIKQPFAEKTMLSVLFPVLSYMNGMITCDFTEQGYPSFFAIKNALIDRFKQKRYIRKRWVPSRFLYKFLSYIRSPVGEPKTEWWRFYETLNCFIDPHFVYIQCIRTGPSLQKSVLSINHSKGNACASSCALNGFVARLMKWKTLHQCVTSSIQQEINLFSYDTFVLHLRNQTNNLFHIRPFMYI